MKPEVCDILCMSGIFKFKSVYAKACTNDVNDEVKLRQMDENYPIASRLRLPCIALNDCWYNYVCCESVL